MQTDCTNLSPGVESVAPFYCGTSTDCIGGVRINGEYAVQIQAGLKSTESWYVAANSGSTALPGGRANALMQCLTNGIQYGGPDYSGDATCSACFSSSPAM